MTAGDAREALRPVVLGLTGSVGMGKSTTARMFAEAGCAVWDADAVVHRLYGPGGAAVAPIRALRPEAVIDGTVSRQALKTWIDSDPDAFAQIERAVHPLVAEDRATFLAGATSDVVVLDIPLLYETGADAEMDAVVVVTAPPEVQRDRVLDRPGMTEAQFRAILAKQLPDADKRARADYIVETVSPDAARAAVREILEDLRRQDARNRS